MKRKEIIKDILKNYNEKDLINDYNRNWGRDLYNYIINDYLHDLKLPTFIKLVRLLRKNKNKIRCFSLAGGQDEDRTYKILLDNPFKENYYIKIIKEKSGLMIVDNIYILKEGERKVVDILREAVKKIDDIGIYFWGETQERIYRGSFFSDGNFKNYWREDIPISEVEKYIEKVIGMERKEIVSNYILFYLLKEKDKKDILEHIKQIEKTSLADIFHYTYNSNLFKIERDFGISMKLHIPFLTKSSRKIIIKDIDIIREIFRKGLVKWEIEKQENEDSVDICINFLFDKEKIRTFLNELWGEEIIKNI